MNLEPGARLGPYEIASQLGSGGMGVVYRARDPRLRRDVAVKVLLLPAAQAPELAARFEREARAAGMLSHPNVVAVFDVGQHDGAPYVVSELLEGETLRERMRRGALPVDAAVRVAGAVARGLAAAHDKGIVHRDLKPENVFLTRDGGVKILDFGIAKLVREEPGPDAASDSTLSLETEAGAILGTVDYMAPEQARGVAIDHRADLFALGVVLFEMIAGKRPFGGKTRVERMMAVVGDPPAELTAPAPAGLRALLERCLAKDPAERFQSARDLAFHLEQLEAVQRPRRSVPLLAAAAALGVAAAATAIVYLAVRPRAGTARIITAPIAEPAGQPRYRQLTFRSGSVAGARFAPDGQTLVYGAAWGDEPLRLYTMRTDRSESRALELPPADVLAVSSSGELALSLGRRRYWWAAEGTLARAPLLGGGPKEILVDVQDADWMADGDSLAVARSVDGRFRIEYPIGNILHETDGWVSQLRIAPDGLRVAFLDHPFRGDDRGNVAVVDMKKQKTTLSTDWTSVQGLAWRPGHDEVWFSATSAGAQRAIYAVTLAGQQRLVLRGPGGLRLQDLAADGRALVAQDQTRAVLLAQPDGERKTRDLSLLDLSVIVDLSGDGKTALISEQSAAAPASYGAYLRATDGAPPINLGDGAADSLSPDGQWVVGTIEGAGDRGELVLWPTGPGQRRALSQDGFNYFGARWFPDGQRLLVLASEAGKRRRFYGQPLAGGAPVPLTREGEFALGFVSPDGTQIAAMEGEGALWLFPVAGGEGRRVTDLDAEVLAGWDEDGRTVFAWQRGRRPAQVVRISLATGKRWDFRELSPPDPAGLVEVSMVRVTPSGRALAYTYFRQLSTLYLVEGLR